MPTCLEFSELSSASVDGELTESEAEELSIHLSSCQSCRDQQLSFAAVRSKSVQAIASVKAPPDLSRSVSVMLRANTTTGAEEPRRRFSWSTLAFTPAFAVACFLFLFLTRPAPLQLTDLDKHSFKLAQAAVFSSPDAALKHLSAELDMGFQPVKVGKGLKFVAAGPVPIEGCKGGFVAFDDSSGRRLAVMQICRAYKDCPKGTSYNGIGLGAQQIKAGDGSRIIYWPCKDKLVVIFTDLPEDQAKSVSKSIAEQLREN